MQNDNDKPTESVSCDTKQTLLKKYDLPVTCLDFEYVEKCTNAREIEKIYHVLLSGEEGYFPELLKTAEEKLKELKPKSKYLRKAVPVLTKTSISQNEWDSITNDIGDWASNISKNDKELSSVKNLSNKNEETKIRQHTKVESKVYKSDNPNRIKSTDYESWDKYDPDAEILKQELVERKIKEEIKRENKTKNCNKCKIQLNKENYVTKAESMFEANKAKNIGNEYFKTEEYENALEHYSRSISLHPTAAAYNNRALTYIKLNKYSDSLNDSYKTLEIEPNNVKALIRRAQAFEALDYFHDALDCVEKAITIEPNNCLAQNMANSLRVRCGKTKYRKNRMLIHDIEESIKEIESKEKAEAEAKKHEKIRRKNIDSKYVKIMSKDMENGLVFEKGVKEETVLVPIPSTSKMSPPWYKTVNKKDAEAEWKRINNHPRLLHLPTIYQENTDDENFEETSFAFENTNTCSKVDKVIDQCIEEVEVLELNDVPFERQETEIEDKYDSSHLKNMSYPKLVSKINPLEKDLKASGDDLERQQDPNSEVPARVETPYSFLRAWSSINKDTTYKKHAEVLSNMDMNRFVDVIGCKLDGDMMAAIVRALSRHLTVPDKVEKVAEILTALVRVQRFTISLMFLNRDDCISLKNLVKFLEQHGRFLPMDVLKELNGV